MKVLFYSMWAKLCPHANLYRRFRLHVPAVCTLALLCWFHGAFAQPKGEGSPSPAGSLAPAPLSVGDTLPPTTVQVSLPEKGRVTIPQAGKLTLLYFWETRCINCWGKFPFLDSMRKKYGDRLNIITITPEPEEKVLKFFGRNVKISKVGLPALMADSLLHQRFPHVLISHVAWLDGNGQVIAITEPDYITTNNIDYVLAGNTPNWRVKADLVQYDGSKPLLSFNKPAGYNVVPVMPEYIFWSQTIPGLENKLYRTTQPDGNRLTYINAGYRSLFAFALHGIPYHPNRYLVPDTMLAYFFKPDTMYSDEWKIRYGACLEMFLPGKPNDALMGDKLKDALESRFGIVFSMDSLMVPVWEISGPGLPVSAITETVYNRSYDWNFLSSVPIVVDQLASRTGFRTDPEPKDLTDFKAFSVWCSKNNLALTATNRKLSMLTIQAKN